MAKPRLPSILTKEDFPSSLTLDIVPPSAGSPVNILILLHGLGDTNSPFTSLAKSLNLPETVCISLQGFTPIPALFTGSDTPSFHWGDDIQFDSSTGSIDISTAGYGTASRNLSLVIGILINQFSYPARNILFLGFGQGGMAALGYLASGAAQEEFGGVVSIGGKLPGSASSSPRKIKCPVLLCGGSRSREITRSAVDEIKERFMDVEYVRWEKTDDTMPRNREEMLPLMKFFARRLRSRSGVPDGAVEI